MKNPYCTILVVDDDQRVVDFISDSLTGILQYRVIKAYNGTQALEEFDRVDPDLIILDIMLPGMDGFEICKQIRSRSTVPILMLTARDDDTDKVTGLDIGADDYLSKPFSLFELIARVKAILRRAGWLTSSLQTSSSQFVFRELVVDLDQRQVTARNKVEPLTQMEFDLLVYLMQTPGRAYSRQELLKSVWRGHLIQLRSVDVHIQKLRTKIEKDPSNPEYILTVRGIGYKFTDGNVKRG